MSRYVKLHEKADGAGDSRPTAMQIIEDEGLVGKMTDKVFIVTGSSVSIGEETARAFAATGGKVYLLVRNLEKTKQNCGDFLEPGRIEMIHMENGSLESVRKAAAEFLKKESKLNVLVNNAGIMSNPERVLTKDGFEEQMGVNYVSHFLLFVLLRDALLAGSTPDFHSRIVNVSSSGHFGGQVDFENMTLDNGDYTPWAAYGQSKTAMIHMTNEIERRYASKGLHGISLMPGGIKSDLQKHFTDEFKATWDVDENIRPYMKSAAQGASTQVIAALGKEYEGKGAKYLEDCVDAKPGDGKGVIAGHAPHAFDEPNEKKLWIESLKLVGEQDDQ